MSPTSTHFVVPIGGTDFIPPFFVSLEKAQRASTKAAALAAASGYYGSEKELEGALSSSPSPSSSPSSSSGFVIPPSHEATFAAHLRYAESLRKHTADQWQSERTRIERTKLGSSPSSSSSGSLSSRRGISLRRTSSSESTTSSGSSSGHSSPAQVAKSLFRGRSRTCKKT